MSKIINSTQANEMLKSVLNDQSIKCYTFELCANYSNDLSSIYYDDFMAEWKNKIIKKDHYMVMFASEEIKNAPHYKISELRKMTKQSLFDLCEYYEILNYSHSCYNYEDNTKADLINEIMRYIDNEKHYTCNDSDYDFTVVGYSQGDAIKIKLVGSEKDFIKDSYLPTVEYLTNIFYDSPISGFIKVLCNGEDVENLDFNSSIAFYEVNDFNEYDYWDKAEFIEKVKNTEWINKLEFFDLLIESLENELPKALSYDY